MTRQKILEFSKLDLFLKKIKKKNIKIGLCHGVYDLLHVGHFNHFKYAKENCDLLFVSVTSDKFVSKGPGRPIFDLGDRMMTLSSLEYIDFVIPSNYESAIEVIKKLKPNYYFKGQDYKNKKNDVTKKIQKEIFELKKYKGIFKITNTKKYSSSKLINSFLNSFSDKQNLTLKNIRKKYTYKDVENIITNLSKLRPLVIGETIIDNYNFCESLGKSGKDPMLVLKDLYSETYIGGGAAISKNMAQFCDKINFLSLIGQKKEYLNFVKKGMGKKVNFIYICKKNSPTIIKKRIIDKISKSKLLGVYKIDDSLISQSEERKIITNFKKLVSKSDFTLISDYGHGMITKKVANTLTQNSKFCSVNAQVNAANTISHSLEKYKDLDFMIINENELRHEMRSKEESLEIMTVKLCKAQNITNLMVTRGSSGSMLYNLTSKKFFYSDAFSQNPIDKIGAGDVMLTMMSMLLYHKIDIELSILISSLCSAESVKYMANKSSINKEKLLKVMDHILS